MEKISKHKDHHKHKSRSRSRSRSKNKKDRHRHHHNKKKNKNDNFDVDITNAQKETKEELEKIKIDEGDLIPALKEDVGLLTKEYNKRLMEGKIKDDSKIIIKEDEKLTNEKSLNLKAQQPLGRTGGVYIPPFKLAQLQKEMMEKEKHGIQHQKLMWELLRKSINGIINKVNISNIQNIIIELLNENIIRGKGLLARAIIKAQMASPNFTHVYAALISVINTKLPEIANLIIRRVILQFQKAFKRNNKIVCMATTKMLAHLINQKVLTDFLGLQLLVLLLENPTEDSVDIACDFMIECGQVLSELTPAGVNSIFERFKGILHEGEIDRRVQYSIENLFAIRKSKFKDHQGVIPELDLVEEEDQITHQISLDDEIDGEEMLNIFKFDPFYDKTEEEWGEIKKEILGEENVIKLKTVVQNKLEEEENKEEEEANNNIVDLSEQDLINLRRTIYLVIMNSLTFEECAHKLLKLNIAPNHENEVCNMIIECCMQERTYLRFYGLLSQRFCLLNEIFKEHFFKCFVEKYTTIHRYETSKLRNTAKLFAHLLYTSSIDWRCLECIVMTQESTTSSSRIFVKILFQEMAENMGLDKLNQKLQDPDLQDFFKGLFPKDHPKNVRFAINFYTSIGLGALTEDLRKYLSTLSQEPTQPEDSFENETSSSDSETSSSSSSSESDASSSSESDSDADVKIKGKLKEKGGKDGAAGANSGQKAKKK